jgi:hypothetical protein
LKSRHADITDAVAEVSATLTLYERKMAAIRDARSPPQDLGGVP